MQPSSVDNSIVLRGQISLKWSSHRQILYLFMPVLGLHQSVAALGLSLVAGEWGLLSVVVHRLCCCSFFMAEHGSRLSGSVVEAHGFSCPHGMWDLCS